MLWITGLGEEAEGAPSVEERAEIRELTRELERVKRERDILGKAVAYFSVSDRGASDGDLFVHRRGAGRQRSRNRSGLVDRRDVPDDSSPIEHENLYDRRGDGIAA